MGVVAVTGSQSNKFYVMSITSPTVESASFCSDVATHMLLGWQPMSFYHDGTSHVCILKQKLN